MTLGYVLLGEPRRTNALQARNQQMGITAHFWPAVILCCSPINLTASFGKHHRFPLTNTLPPIPTDTLHTPQVSLKVSPSYCPNTR